MHPRGWPAALILLAALALCTQGRGAQETAETTSETDWADCLGCHDLGGDNLPTLSDLRIPGFGGTIRRDCLECHERVDLAGINNVWSHDTRPLAAHVDCLVCHSASPHGTENPPKPARWGKRTEEQCFSCHRTIELALAQQYSHGFVPGVRCRDCHNPHKPLQAALPEPLLSSDIAELRGTAYDWRESNRLCMGCHPEAELTLSLSRGFVTLNTVNYHSLHLERGRVMCIECHDPHGSLHQGMLRTQLLTGEIFGFHGDLEGGTCAVRCHGVNHERWTYRNKVH